METAADRIVVGVDGSPVSTAALRWAVDQAGRTGATVDAVSVWEVPATIFLSPTATEADYEDAAEHALADALSGVDVADVAVHRHVVQGAPATVLTGRAEGARLLVIGTHGHGGLPGRHLGSVASYCVHHAPCPVLVYRDHTGAGDQATHTASR